MISKTKLRFKWIVFILFVIAGGWYLFKDSLPMPKTYSDQNTENVYVDGDGIEHKISMGLFPEVPTILARFFVGKHKTICGEVSQRAKTRTGAFINFGGEFPKQDFSIVIWGDIEKNDLPVNGQRLCVTGFVSEYKGTPQIELRSLNAQIYYQED